MRKKKDTHSFDFRPLGLAIREARENAGLSRNDLGDKVFYGGPSEIVIVPALDGEFLYNVFFQLRLDHTEIFWATGY